jgi:hypothetical protein
MRTVQIYVGREVTDIDCIRVTFTLDGQSQTINVPRIDFLNGRPQYLYNADLTEGDFIITEDGDYITTEDGDYLITEQSVFTPAIQIFWDGTQWIIEIIINGVTYTYTSLSDVYYPYLSNWEVAEESPELQYLVTSPCTDLKYERIELFDDEKINITLNVQTLSDLAAIRTDFSQSFTVPGSNVNNKIFEHFYQNDVDGTIDHNLKRPAFIEIDFIPFRQGVISLEKANMKNGLVDNYSISFFGQLTSLKDIFGETKINQLNLSSLAFTYNGTNVLNRITDTATDYDVRFPLIANNRLWTYADGTVNDITTVIGGLNYGELFPAVKVARLFDAIQNDFDVNFVGDFFTDERFTKLFLEAKNANLMSFFTQISDVTFDTVSTTTVPENNYNPQNYVSIPNSTLTIDSNAAFNALIFQININLVVNTKSSAETAYLDIFKNGSYFSTINITTVGTYSILVYGGLGANSIPIPSNNEIFNFQLKANVAMNIDMDFSYESYFFNSLDPFGSYGNISTINTNLNVLTADLDIRNHLPDMRITDFFTGIMRQFNMTCVGLAERQFQVLPLENWYNNGATIDVTKYTDSETADISKVPLFRNINFRYQKSESFANRNYFAISNSEYGDTDNVYSYDGGDYRIESPFENLLFVEAVGTTTTNTAILGYFLNQNYQSYIPKPTLLYLYGNTGTIPVPIKFYNGTTNVNITNYTLFGQDVVTGGNNFSLNFGADNSIITKNTEQNGLFATYYFSYLSNLYNLKQRLTTVKAMLPLSVITNIQLNDRLVIRDKRYIINDIKMELTTGEATLTLYNDFRDIQLQNYRIVDSGLNFVFFIFVYREGNNSATITRTPVGMTLSTNTINWVGNDRGPKVVAGTVSVNTSGLPRRFTVTTTYVNGPQLFNYVIQEA